VDRHKAALALGARMTDAFIAVEARGSQEVRNVLLEARAFEMTLGIAEKMQKRSHRIGDLADNEQWAALRLELEYSILEEEALLREQLDLPLAELVQIGSLVRAINAGCDIVEDLKLEDLSMCIGDVTLIIHLIKTVEALPKLVLQVRAVRDLRRCLKEVRDIWLASPAEPPVNKVGAVRDATRSFLDSLTQNE
jgi:hypothetical protein